MRQHETEKPVLDYLDRHADALYALLSKLIAFDSQNFISHGRERQCAEYIFSLYQELGLEAEIYNPDDVPGATDHPEYLPGRGTDNRPNVSGELKGAGDGRVMIAAHIDTMPAGDPDKWELSPFSGAVQDGKIYGLGSSDNKFGIAGSYMALKALRDCGVRLKKSVVLTSYADEEYGGGNGTLAACLKYPCDTYANLDGGNYELWVAALGGCGYRLDFHKRDSTDSFMPVYEVFEHVVRELKSLGEHRRRELHVNPLYTGSDMERSVFRLYRYGGVGTTCTDGTMQFVIYTTSPKEVIDAELGAILASARPLMERHNITTGGFMPISRFFHYLETDLSDGSARVMRQAAEETAGRPVKVCGACLTDLNLFLSCGSRHSFNFGILKDFGLPGGAHQPNEFVEQREFLQHTKALALFLIRWCGAA